MTIEKEHELKIWPSYYDAVRSGAKTFELRKDDRGFAIGDRVHLREWDPDHRVDYTGRGAHLEITYIVRDAERFGIMPGYCVFAFQLVSYYDPQGGAVWI